MINDPRNLREELSIKNHNIFIIFQTIFLHFRVSKWEKVGLYGNLYVAGGNARRAIFMFENIACNQIGKAGNVPDEVVLLKIMVSESKVLHVEDF